MKEYTGSIIVMSDRVSIVTDKDNVPILGEHVRVNGIIVTVTGIEMNMTNPPTPTGLFTFKTLLKQNNDD